MNLEETLRVLYDAGVESVLIGGAAMVLQGSAHLTGDTIDGPSYRKDGRAGAARRSFAIRRAVDSVSGEVSGTLQPHGRSSDKDKLDGRVVECSKRFLKVHFLDGASCRAS